MIWTGDTPKGNECRMDCRDGTSDENICRLISNLDEYGLGGLDLRGTAIDVGAHIGSVSVPLLIDNPELRVVSVEPVFENVMMLRRNLALNRVEKRSIVMPVAAGIDGTVPISHGYPGRHQHIGNIGGSRPKHTDQIASMSFSSIRAGIDTEMVALLKLDCEGCEWDILDDPDIWRAEMIVGEFHYPRQADGACRVEDLLADSHRVSFDEWTFQAVLK